MYAVVRQYSGAGATALFDEIEQKHAEVEGIIRGVPGFVAYTALRTSGGGVTVTVCQDKAGTDESIRAAAAWVRENATVAVSPPAVSEGATILQLS